MIVRRGMIDRTVELFGALRPGRRHRHRTRPRGVSHVAARRHGVQQGAAGAVRARADRDAPAGGPYVVKYGGLRLLTRRSDGTMYLLPRHWRHSIDPVFLLPAGAPIRLEIVATPDDG